MKVRLGRMVLGSRQLYVQAMRANVRRILKTHAARIERFVRNSQSIFAGLGRGFADGKGIFAALRFGFESDELHNHVVVSAHFPAGTAAATATAATFFVRFARLRFGGVPSAISTTIMLVTNFFIPCKSKSMEVRSLSDSVMTP